MKRNRIIFFVITVLTLLIDQISKYVIELQPINEKVTIIPHLISFEKVYNSGAAFSIMQNNTFILIFISLVVLGFVFWHIFKNEVKLIEIIALGLISGGAIGNLIDRVFHGFVIDFIQTEFITFPIFNFADTFINIGVIILIVSILFLKNDK
ncbi:MAG: signal peptidase II [Candidatus Gastranaerophilales bacterium]|nr:signal peptidase II [Candidatus Gastranaerophilales bacterium]